MTEDPIARRNANIALILSAISLLLLFSILGMVLDNEWHIDGIHNNQINDRDDIRRNSDDIDDLEEIIFTLDITENASISEDVHGYARPMFEESENGTIKILTNIDYELENGYFLGY